MINRRRPPQPRPRRAALAALALALAASTGCGSAPPAQPTGRINVLPVRPSVWTDPGDPVSRHATKCLVRTVFLPLNRPTEVAWATLDETALPELSRAVWNANGLRLGILDAADAGDFGTALGPPDRFSDQSLIAIDLPTELRESPRLQATFTADLTRPPGPQHLETFTGYKARMLIAASPSARGATVTLTPQHFVPKASLLARGPLQKLLDGRVFEELAASVEIRPGQALVLGYALPVALRPPLPVEPDDEDAEGKPDAPAAPDTPTPDLNIDPQALPLDLGRALLTEGRATREQQRLIVLTVLETR